MVGPVRIKDHQREQRIFFQRALLSALVICGMTMVLLGRLAQLQVVRYEEYKLLAEGNQARIEYIPANRGLILDRNGSVLAENQPSYQLELVRERVADLEATIRGLVSIGVIPGELFDDVLREARSRRVFESVAIQRRLTEEQIAAFAVHRHEFPGVEIHSRSTRHYPYGSLGVHALGYVGTISETDLKRIDETAYRGTMVIGKRGVEGAREAELHGVNGFREILVNAQGRSVQDQAALELALRERKPQAGADLILSLDLPTQQAAEQGFEGRRGSAIALDPNTGDVLAFVSLPGFDPSLFGRGITSREYRALEADIDKPLFNRAIMGTYPPGSTVKPVLGMAGLAYNKVGANEPHFCPGYFQVPNSSRRAREGRGGVHGAVDMRTAISKSCDVYFYSLALELGVDLIHEFLLPFGFGRLTGIDIAGEVSGNLPSREWKRKRFGGTDPSEGVWYPGDTVNFGIGQGFMNVTLMQLAQVTAVLAAQGKVFQPRLVTGVRDPQSGDIQRIEPVSLPHVPGGTPEQWKVIMEGMRETMISGTARAIAKSAAYTMAGKTGTAQVFTVAQNQSVSAVVQNERLRDHSWFIAFAPAEDPKIAVAVLVENGGFGASAAAPIARSIFDAYLLPRLPTAVASAQAPAQRSLDPGVDHEDGHDHDHDHDHDHAGDGQ